jgi:hypothetical protein
MTAQDGKRDHWGRHAIGTRAPGLLSVLAALAFSGAAQAASQVDLTRALSGAWELANPKASRSCRLTLGADPVAGGHQVGAPPACRIAVPLLVQVSAWTINEDKSISLVDSAGKSVIDFRTSGGNGHFAAKAGQETYVLSPLVGTRDADRTGSIAAALAPVAGPVPSAKPGQKQAAAGAAPAAATAAELPPLRSDALVGLYGVAREKNKPICSLDLAATPIKKTGTFAAKLSGGCIDPGLKVFDPIAWRIDKGHLVLIARKGHEQGFAQGADGVFTKDPPSGAQLFLRKQ